MPNRLGLPVQQRSDAAADAGGARAVVLHQLDAPLADARTPRERDGGGGARELYVYDTPPSALSTRSLLCAAGAGLGYYRRARFLREGARYAVEHTGGQLPQTADALLKVPGIGPYTAASVSSIAFGQQRAAVDGNVIRVLSRIYAHLQAEPAKAAAVREMQAAVRPSTPISRRRPYTPLAG